MAIGRPIIGPQISDSVTTTDATANVLLLECPIPDNYAGAVSLALVGQHSTDDVAYLGEHCVVRDGVAATYCGVVGTEVRLDNGSAGWTITVDCSGVNFRVRVTGEAAHTINWGAVATFALMVESYA